MITAIAAAVIALTALTVSVWQGLETRNHNRLAATPIFAFDTFRENEGSQIKRVLCLRNIGVGPAIIKKITYYVDDKQIVKEGLEAAFEFLRELDLYEPEWIKPSLLSPNYWVKPGQCLYLISAYLEGNQESQRERKFRCKLRRFRVKIEFESVYKQRRIFDKTNPTETSSRECD